MADAERAQLDALLRAVQQETKDWSPQRVGSRLAGALAQAASANDSGANVEAALKELQAAWLDATDPRGELSATPPEQA